MSDIDVMQQFETTINLFDNQNMQTVMTRLNDYLQKAGILYTVTNIKYVLQIDPPDAIITAFNYSNITEPLSFPVIAYDHTVNNSDSDTSVDVSVKYSKTLEEIFSFSFNEGIKISTTVKVAANLPLIGKSEVAVSGEASFQSTQTWTKRESKTWESTDTIRIKAGESDNIKVSIINDKINSPFTAKIIMGPLTWIYFSVDTTGGSHSVWVPLTAIYTRDEVLNDLSISVSGNFVGVEGVNVITTVTPI